MTIEDKKIAPDSFTIYSALYFWYEQQNLSLNNKLKNRSHFCLLMFIQNYLENNLKEHSQDSSAVAISDSYKENMKCNSDSFNKLFNIYFDKSINAIYHHSISYANGYTLKDTCINELFHLLNQEFENTNELLYCEIEDENYQETIFYETPLNGLIKKKGEALKLNGLSRKKEDLLKEVKLNILQNSNIKIEKKTSFHIPDGYFKYPLTINTDYLRNLIKDPSINKLHKLFYMRLVTINSVYP